MLSYKRKKKTMSYGSTQNKTPHQLDKYFCVLFGQSRAVTS